MDYSKLVGKRIKHKKTGMFARVVSYCEKPSVTIHIPWTGKINFAVGSPLADNWEEVEEAEDVAEVRESLKEEVKDVHI